MTGRWARRDPLDVVTQVANGRWGQALPTPDPAAANAVKAAWSAVLSGQAIPMIGEEVPDVRPHHPGDAC